ncbi:unnamed protein product [Durusdinium trenchii]|uniref:PKD/REJ-like domain-containing protein n=1 Tax=Durusdinium trenchii TaxID=1381693 RepID=A0ABP0JH36_9DINO
MGSSFYSTTVQLELVAQVTNWLAQSDQASVLVTLETMEEPMPIVSPTSAQEATILNSQEVSFSVVTQYADTSSCGVASTPQQVVVTWEYRVGDGTWGDLPTTLTDLDRRPGGLRFAAFSFETGSVHEFRVTARYTTSSLTATAPQYVFRLVVSPPAPPVVRILGPSSVSDACSFSFDASGSYDPALAPGTTSNLAFAWSCATHSSSFDCSQLSSLAGAGAQLAVEGGALQEGLYNFAVEVSRSGGGASVEVWQLEVSNGALPAVAINVPWGNNEAVSTQVGGQLASPSATVQGGPGCTVPSTWAWSFLLLEDNGQDGVLAFLNTSSSRQGDSLTIGTSEWRGDLLIPGAKYLYAVLQTPTEEEMLALVSSPPGTLSEALARGARAVKSLPFVADGPPTGGLVQCSPQSGYAVATSFSGTTSGWYDEDVARRRARSALDRVLGTE